MIWTRNKPTKAGWWWYRDDETKEAEIHVIWEIDGTLFPTSCSASLSEMNGEWSSEPIEEPKEAT